MWDLLDGGLIKNRKYERDDARATPRLISETFARFCASEGTAEAVDSYVQSYDPKGKNTATSIISITFVNPHQ
jgi:hypothetical protein